MASSVVDGSAGRLFERVAADLLAGAGFEDVREDHVDLDQPDDDRVLRRTTGVWSGTKPRCRM